MIALTNSRFDGNGIEVTVFHMQVYPTTLLLFSSTNHIIIFINILRAIFFSLYDDTGTIYSLSLSQWIQFLRQLLFYGFVFLLLFYLINIRILNFHWLWGFGIYVMCHHRACPTRKCVVWIVFCFLYWNWKIVPHDKNAYYIYWLAADFRLQ